VSQLRHSERAYYIPAEIFEGQKNEQPNDPGRSPHFSAPKFFCQNCLRALAVQHRFSKPKWKVEWKIDGNNFPLGPLGIAKIVGKIAHRLSRKWNFLSTTKNSEWKIGKAERASAGGSKTRPQPPDVQLPHANCKPYGSRKHENTKGSAEASVSCFRVFVILKLFDVHPPDWKNSGRKLN
jgi:hypothetical protein